MRLTHTKNLRVRRGFSLLEMLVVVILIGIIMSVAGVKMTNIRTQQRVVRAASTIQTQMEQAFAIAGRNRAPMLISFSTSSSAIYLRVTDRTATTEYGRVDFVRLGFKNGQVTASSNSVTVFPQGLASSTLTVTISVTVNGATYTRIVTMSRAGMIKVNT
jgi:prepilin-type N-terminal cleavage/methylation domain-containing protein